MNYILWHTPRTGSNFLCNLLHLTQVAGIKDYENCGFHIPQMYKENLSTEQFLTLSNLYLDRQRTTNGISGCKGGITYYDEIKKQVGNDAAYEWFGLFDKHIFLMRRDLVGQAVSALFAGHTKRWTSKSKTDIPDPAYHKGSIMNTMCEVAGQNARLLYMFGECGIEPKFVYYEDLLIDAPTMLKEIMHFLNIEDEYTFRPAEIEKQLNPKKLKYSQLYHLSRGRYESK